MPEANRGSGRARVLLVGAVVLGVVSAFLGVGGWLSPHAVTPTRFIDTFEEVNGPHPGFRRNHAKGVGVSGSFESNGQGARLSRAIVFRPGRVSVLGRFALAGGMPYIPDAPTTVRSMALLFALPNGEEWRTGMNAMPVFAVRTPEAFHDQLLAFVPDPNTGKADPARVSSFLTKYHESARALQLIKAQTPARGFAESTYNSLNAFGLVDASGRSTPIRWSMEPAQDNARPSPGITTGPNYLFDALAARLRQGPLQWHLVLVVGQPGDPTNDATAPWPPDRERIDAGILTLDRIASEQTSPARVVNFDPLILPDGIVGSDDPLLSARSAAYSVSFRRRVGEPESPSAVTPAEVGE